MSVNYIEKGEGLHQAISEAGHTLVQRNRVWESSDDVAVQAIIDAYPSDFALERKRFIQELNDLAQERRDASTTPGKERVYQEKRAEVEKFITDSMPTSFTVGTYPYIEADMAANNIGPRVAAQAIRDACLKSQCVDQAVETLYADIKAKIKAATNPQDMKQLIDTVKSQLAAIGD